MNKDYRILNGNFGPLRKKLPAKMPQGAFRMLISLTLKDLVNMELVVFCDPKNITRGGVPDAGGGGGGKRILGGIWWGGG